MEMVPALPERLPGVQDLRTERTFRAATDRMCRREFRMFVRNDVGILRRPEESCEQDTTERDRGEGQQGRNDSNRGAGSAGDGVSL